MNRVQDNHAPRTSVLRRRLVAVRRALAFKRRLEYVPLYVRRRRWDARSEKGAERRFREAVVLGASRDWHLDVDSRVRAEPGFGLPFDTDLACENLCKFENVLVEPHYGYVIIPPSTCVDESVLFSELPRSFRKSLSFSGVPYWSEIRQVLSGRSPAPRIASAVSMRHPFDYNFYHFMIEVLPRLEVVDRVGVPTNAQLLISRRLAEQPFFGEASARDGFRQRNWAIHDRYLWVDELYVPRPLDGGSVEGATHSLGLLGAPQPTSGTARYIFLDRPLNAGRTFVNRTEILAVVEDAGFEVFDPAQTSLLRLAEVIAGCSRLASVHGAGLTNMIFRTGTSLQVREVFPPDETSVEFMVLARRLGFEYAYARAEHTVGHGRRADYVIDPQRFAALLG